MSHGPPAGEALKPFFDRAEKSFAEAVARSGAGIDHEVQIAGHPMRLRFAGPALVDAVMPALRHLEAPSPAPALTALLWDSRSTGVGLLPPPWDALPHFERGDVLGFQDERFALVYDRRTRAFSAVDNSRGFAVYWVQEAEGVPYFERAAPLRHVLQGWLQREGLFVAHASAVGRSSGGVVLSGRSGCGKSTTAVLCLRSQLGYLGDDFVLLSANGEPHAYSLYACAKLNPTTLPWLPDLTGEVSNREHLDVEKALIFWGGARRGLLLRGFPLRAVLLPRIRDQRDTVLEPVSPRIAFRMLAPDTLFRSLGNPGLTSRGLHGLVHKLPCYEIALGRDLTQIPRVIGDLLAHA